jgi:hypothetical protein
VMVFRTDFRISCEMRADQPAIPAADMAPYNLMLTESADVRLDLFRESVEQVAAKIDAALKGLPPRPASN